MRPVFRTIFHEDRERLFSLVLGLFGDSTAGLVVERQRAALLALDDGETVVSEHLVGVLLLTELDVGKVKVLEEGAVEGQSEKLLTA